MVEELVVGNNSGCLLALSAENFFPFIPGGEK